MDLLKSSMTFNVALSYDATYSTSQFVKFLPWSTVSAATVKWKHLGATTAKPRSGRPHKLTEQDRRVLKRVARKNHLSSVATLTTKFQTASGSNVSTRTVRRELHEMGFHGRAATHKPKITIRKAKRRLEWCKARCHWTLEQWKRILMNHASLTGSPTETPGFGGCQENDTCTNA